jgi:anthranilate synthase component 1
MLYIKISLPSIISKNEAYIFCHSLDGKTFQKSSNYYNLGNIASQISEGEGFSNLTDEEFKHNVLLSKTL